MKLAVMQPYFFPYIGYFQLIASVDKFVFLDDVNFINRGWINRNRLLMAGGMRYITVPLSGASQFSKINRIAIHSDESWRRKIMNSLHQWYSKAPHFGDVNKMVSEVLVTKEDQMSELAKKSVIAVSRYLGLGTQFVMSSSVYDNADLNGSERIIDICLKEQASDYHNLPGGKKLYNHRTFLSHGVRLGFMKPNPHEYRQFSKDFYPNLSIIDVLMFNHRDSVREMVKAEVEMLGVETE